jgi:hypothetical protein
LDLDNQARLLKLAFELCILALQRGQALLFRGELRFPASRAPQGGQGACLALAPPGAQVRAKQPFAAQ